MLKPCTIAFAEKLINIGWASQNDAQWTRLEAFLKTELNSAAGLAASVNNLSREERAAWCYDEAEALVAEGIRRAHV